VLFLQLTLISGGGPNGGGRKKRTYPGISGSPLISSRAYGACRESKLKFVSFFISSPVPSI